MNYDPYAVGERIQSLRKECELTQDQLAIDLNISDRYMRNLERGERVPSIDLFVELRERFGASLDRTWQNRSSYDFWRIRSQVIEQSSEVISWEESCSGVSGSMIWSPYFSIIRARKSTH